MSLPVPPGQTPRGWQLEAVDAAREGLQHWREVLISAATGCHARGQLIMRHDGTLVPVEDVRVGDLLMGPDSTPRTVLSLARGHDQMVRIVPVKGEPWVVNIDHVLSLVDTRNPDDTALVDVTVREWLSWGPNAKHLHKLVRRAVEYPPSPDATRPIPAYHLGLLIGDGVLGGGTICVTKPDPEVRSACQELATTFGLLVRDYVSGAGVAQYRIVKPGGTGGAGLTQANPLASALVSLGLRCTGEDRRIPESYLRGPRADRLALLAGLVDSDGHLAHGGIDWIAKSEQLARDVTTLARGLGFAAYVKPAVKRSQFGGGTYWRVSISGDLSVLPNRIPRKRAEPRRQIKSVLRTGLRVEMLGFDDYFGFGLDGDRRYLLGDFTVTHNTGKGTLIAGLGQAIADNGGRVLVLAHREELVDEIPQRIRKLLNHASTGVVMADRHEPHAQIVCASVQSCTEDRRRSMGRFDVVLTDEAHHATAPSYGSVYDWVAANNPDWQHIGFTATPFRAGPDGTTKGLGSRFGALVYQYSIAQAIHAGDLVPLQAFGVETELSLNGVNIDDDDELAKAVDTPDRNRLIVEQYQLRAPGRPGLAFAASIEHARHIAEAFREAGIRAEAVWGDMPRDQRRSLVAEFRRANGSLPVLVSKDLLFEGFDAPAASIILKARPTRSPIVFQQMVGRGLRTHGVSFSDEAPAERRAIIAASVKPHCILVDLVDNGCEMQLVTAADLTDDGQDKAAEVRPLQPGDRVRRRHHDDQGVGEVLQVMLGPIPRAEVRWPANRFDAAGPKGVHPWSELVRVTGAEAEQAIRIELVPRITRATAYELFLLPQAADEGKTRPGWYPYRDTLSCGSTYGDNSGRGLTLVVMGKPGAWDVWESSYDPNAEPARRNRVRMVREGAPEQHLALQWAEAHLRASGAQLVPWDARWRGEMATAPQVAALTSLNLKRDFARMTRGEASALIDACTALRNIRERQVAAHAERRSGAGFDRRKAAENRARHAALRSHA